MFVVINNTDMNVFKIDEWINHTRDANGGVISPEFAMEVLSKTNFRGHIKKVLKNIRENCTTKEQLMPYKEFILSCVDGREMSGEAMASLQEMARVCDCEEEFEKANAKPKFYGEKDCEAVIIQSREEFKNLKNKNLKIYFDTDCIDLGGCDLSGFKELKFKDGAVVDLNRLKDSLPEYLDFSMCDSVGLRYTDLNGLNELKFKDGAVVDLTGAKHFPEVLDLSMCLEVYAEYCDLSGVKEIKFKDKEQEKKFMAEAKIFSGKVVYMGEDKKTPVVSRDIDMEM